MARPRKCRICGYRFKDGEDICPECFTARDDDISCEQFGNDEHTHSDGFSTTHDSDIYDEFRERSFVDEQRTDEANDPIPSSTYGGKQGTPPPTYAQQSYSQPAGNSFGSQQQSSFGDSSFSQSRLDKLNALRRGKDISSYNTAPNTYYGRQQQGSRVYYTRNGTPKKGNKTAAGIVVVIFLMIFFIPFIIGIMSAIGRSTSSRSKSTTTTRKPLNVEVSMPDFSFPDISVPDVSDFDPRQATRITDTYTLTAKFISVLETIGPENLDSFFTPEQIKTAVPQEGYVPEDFRIVSMDFHSEAASSEYEAPEIVATGCYLETLDSKGRTICNSYLLNDMESGFDFVDAEFLIPADYGTFKLHLLLNNSGKVQDMVVHIMTYNIYKDYDEDSSSGENASAAGVKVKDV